MGAGQRPHDPMLSDRYPCQCKRLCRELYRSWQAYMQASGEDAGTQKSFGDRLRRTNLKRATMWIDNRQTRVWKGIQLSNVGYDDPYHDR